MNWVNTEGADETLDTLSTGGIQILQPRKGYRYSLDALILPFFMDLEAGSSILELGAGCGVIALLLARRCPTCRVTAVELQHRLYRLMEKNLLLNGLVDRIRPVREDIRSISTRFHPESFDSVCANPPFRKAHSGRISPNAERAIARHEIALSLEELVGVAAHLLRKEGRFSLIYLPERLDDLLQGLTRNCLEPKRIRMIHSFPGSPPVLFLLEAVKNGATSPERRTSLIREAPFTIYKGKGKEYSKEMQAIYDFKGEF
jgi:tRNA1Val (adenine37-N6)-methyltransferase